MNSDADKTHAPGASRKLAGSERPRAAGATLRAPLDPDERVSATLLLRRKPGSPALPDHRHWETTPPGRRQHLTPQQYAETYGAAESDLRTVVDFLISEGITVLHSHAGRRTVSIEGSAAQLNALFGIQLNSYESPRHRLPRQPRGTAEPEEPGHHVHHGYEGAIHLPAELAEIVTAVVGLDNRALGGPAGGTGDPAGANLLAVSRIAQLYNFPNSGAADQTIGVFAPTDPPGSSGRRFSGYLSNDITGNYFPNLSSTAYRTAPVLNDISLTVGTNTYSNSTATAQGVTSANLSSNSSSFVLEVTQDISTSATIAQGATVNVYFTENSEQGWLVFLNRVLLPEGEKQPTVVTCSWVLFSSDDSGSLGSLSDSGSVASVMTELFQQLAVLGINVFIATGDWGADDSLTDGKTHVMYPASDPWITSCGGTVVGNIQSGPPVSFDEFVWSDAFSSSSFGSSSSDFGATGGGASQTFPIPSWQTSAGITQISDSKGNTLKGRFVPDVAGMVGYSGSGSSDWFFVNGIEYNFIGTSCVAPLYAGLYAVLRSAFGVSPGFLNPILYQLGNSVCNDVTSGNNDSGDTPDSPFFTASAGWDACTGWGSIDGTKLLNGIASLMYNQTFYFQVQKSTYGLDEVSVSPQYSPAFWLVLEGFTPSAASGITPQVAGAFSALKNVTITVGAAQPELPSQPSTPQRILYPCDVSFGSAAVKSVADGGIFPSPGAAPFSLPLSALVAIEGELLAAATVFELAAGADPFFSNYDAQASNVFYLSQDLRVFTVTPGINNAPVAGVPLLPADNNNYDSGAAYNYIQALLSILNANNGDATGSDVFSTFPDQSSALSGDSSVTPNTIDPAHPSGKRFANYNFAVARVRMNGQPNTASLGNVRVFFRMFATQTSDTDYLVDWTYPSTTSGGLPTAPLLGTGDPPVTIPFFATGNYEGNSDHPVNTDYSAGSVNNQPVQIGPGGHAWAYYGCYLNIYPTANTIGGKAVQSLLPGTHHCIVAQIAYDGAPIVNSSGTTESPENSDKLAQRNLEITLSDNPGPASTHRIPQTFDLRRSPALSSSGGDLLDYPDELMIDWGNTPVGTTAHIYWPQVHASEVLALATRLYSTHQLSASDSNTIRCAVPHGFTYIPVPPGTGENYAGLFTLDLPPGIRAGQLFTLVVRRIASRRAELKPPPITASPRRGNAGAQTRRPEKIMRNWRYVTGSFAVQIPVTTAHEMLPLEENTLAIMKWRLAQLTPANRWHPVLVRYIQYLSGRVDGLGGNSISILPNPWGVPPAHPVPGEDRCEYTGKVCGVIYDRFGDFEGFVLLTEEGQERRFSAREKEIERLVRIAWAERMVIRVAVELHAPHIPARIILLRLPEAG